MGFIPNEPQSFINIKLTDSGRRQLSLGRLTFSKAVFSDREINYGIDRTNFYDILNNRVLSPVDFQPSLSPINFDGTNAFNLDSSNVVSAKQFITAHTTTAGLFSGSSPNYVFDNTKYLGKRAIQYSANTFGIDTISLSAGTYVPTEGSLVYINWNPIQNSGNTFDNSDSVLPGNPTVGLFYRIESVADPVITLDRPTPAFNSSNTSQAVNAYFYPWNGIEDYYGTASTRDALVWNMNIVRTESVEGRISSMSGYTHYGSIEYNGAKQYFGFSSDTKAVGIVHYSNLFSGNTYAEQLIEKTFTITLPTLMWHNIGLANGQGVNYGLTLTDVYGSTFFDSISQTTFRELRDGVGAGSKVVGRVYHKLKMVVITDPELLTALSYKTNRNYTLPEPVLSLSSNPKFPLDTTKATGLCKSGYTYFVTYIPESRNSYASGSSYGYAPALHCSYVRQIEGVLDVNGNKQFLNVAFPSNAFPYLRNSAGMTTFSGTGWNANSVQILVNEQANSFGYTVGTVPSTDWKRVSSVKGNGIYSASTDGDLTIDANKLAGYNFVISQEDYTSGSTYMLAHDITATTINNLTFGDEDFFFGNVDVDILATNYKTLITVFAKNDQLDTSTVNNTFDATLDEKTYITEIAVLDTQNNVVAVGKPTYAIPKNDNRFLSFQLELDF